MAAPDEWETPLMVVPSLSITVAPDGRLVASCESRSPRLQFKPDLMIVLMAFLSAATPSVVYERLTGRGFDIDRELLRQSVGQLRDAGLLIAARADSPNPAATPHAAGFSAYSTHHYLLRDAPRVLAYKTAIQRHAPGRTVLEIGCGTGVLSILAAQAGARRVIAVEEGNMVEVAKEMVAVNDVADRVTVVKGNSRTLDLDEPVDLVIHELIGEDPFDENVLPSIVDARKRLMREDGRLMPYRLEVCCTGCDLALHEEVVREATEFDALYGVNFRPFTSRLQEHALAEDTLPRRGLSTRTRITEECKLFDLDLRRLEHASVPAVVHPLVVCAQGRLCGVEVYFRAHLDESTCLANAPHAPPTHWGRRFVLFDRRPTVIPGQLVEVRASVSTHLGRQHSVVVLA